MAANQIGTMEFWNLERPGGGGPHRARQTGVWLRRKGTNGEGYKFTGIKGEPFTMISYRDCLSFAASEVFRAEYENAQYSAVPLAVIWLGVNFDTYNTRYVVENVDVLEQQALAASVGGFHGVLGTVFIRVEWTLRPVLI